MKQRDIFRVLARAERRSKIAKAWKVENEIKSVTEDLGWFIVVNLGGQEFAFYHGDDEPKLTERMINLVLEYSIPETP